MAHRSMSNFIVAVDGPAGSGKSSVSKQVARELGFGYLDTGAAYRALAWQVLQAAATGGTEQALNAIGSLETPDQLAAIFDYSISTDPDNFWVKVGDTDVTEVIRSTAVAEFVSQVARIQVVREFMKQLTRNIAATCEKPGIIIEGRDITTVVAPDAQKRLLVTASETVRLERRGAELAKGQNPSSDAVAAEKLKRQISGRDASDAKVVDFMTPAPGVTLVDTTELDFNQTVRTVLDLINQAS
jgi:cytidylate kinase